VLLEMPPLELVPPVVPPPAAFKEQPKNNGTASKAMRSANNRTPAVRGLRPEASFVMESSCLHLVQE
jgi:hypothetical protein